MRAWTKIGGDGVPRSVSRTLAAILLIAQLLAVAHYHLLQSTSRSSASLTANFDDGLCALCLFHNYSPSASTAGLFPIAPTLVGRIDHYAAQSWPLYSFNSYLSGRSPPSSS
jgi:hypothetical protein